MKFDKSFFGKDWIPYTIAACSAVIVYLLLSHLGSIWGGIKVFFGFLSPVLSAIIIAYVVDAQVMFFDRTIFKKIRSEKIRRNLSIVFSLVLILALLAMLVITLIPQLIESIRALVGNLGGYMLSLQETFHEPVLSFGSFNLDISAIIKYGESLMKRAVSGLQENMGRVLNTSVNIGKGFFNGVICCILAIYFLLYKGQLFDAVKKLMWQHIDGEKYRRITDLGRQCNRIMVRYIACDLLDGFIVGAANFTFMLLLGMPYTMLVSVVVALTNLLPTFGPIIGGAVGAFILLLANPGHMVWFLVFTVVLQTVDGYILKPHLFGDSLGVPPLWVLVAVIVGGRIFGVWGIMLAIPFAAISDFIFRDIVWTRLTAQQAAQQAGQLASQQLRDNAVNNMRAP